MQPFAYVHAESIDHALASARRGDARYIAGGTTLIDLMRLEVMRPTTVVDITGLAAGLAAIEDTGRGVRIGALATNTDVAYHPLITARFPALSEALLSGASPQLRNMATVGGNLMQRTRCPYFRDGTSPCNKRAPGSGCAALDGYTRSHAVLGTSGRCIATHPSDMCVALVALDAVVHTRGPSGNRAIPVTELHTLPGDHPEIESVLVPGELVTHVELPATPLAARSRYTKVRDRASFSFALASAAVALELRAGTVHDARIALGGLATRPWRAVEAERWLIGKRAALDSFRRAAAMALDGAAPRDDNAFKVELGRRTVLRALQRGAS
ncbi:MAG TPA: xanthine dehydrogenase family protein subunit M [Kofleriaceae bacterium]|jgi:xanthine dehydrogenase YagS FAD-binding subunit|nr:xanthine dehydrogenase family protein subunit M [Kofleriaceae bacterium]